MAEHPLDAATPGSGGRVVVTGEPGGTATGTLSGEAGRRPRALAIEEPSGAGGQANADTSERLRKIAGELGRRTRELEESRAKLRRQAGVLESILESMSDGVVVADEKGSFLHFNAAARRIMHLGPQEGGPDLWNSQYGLYLPDQETPFPTDQNPLVRAMRGEEVEEVEIFVRHREAPEGFWLSVNARPLRNKKGHLRGGIVVFRNVTERVKAQRALALRTQELARSNAQLEQFAYMASHDLQAPLRNIAGYAQLLRQRTAGRLDADAAGYLESLVEGAERMEVLIHDLLALARVGAGERRVEPVDCEAVLDRVLRDLVGPIHAAGGVITREELPVVNGDPTHLPQLFQNLLSNAIKFHGERPPRVHVSAERGRGEWIFSVQDNGIGIEAGGTDLIFGAFKRLHDRGAFPGTGIGLAICKKIVEGHGGRIWIESVPGRGSTFLFTLPPAAREM